jgi:stage II sporulation protein D
VTAPRFLLPLLAIWASACTVAGRRAGGPEIPYRPAGGIGSPETPDVRIGIAVDAPQVAVETGGRLELTDDAGVVRDRGAGTWTVTRASGRIQARGPSQTVEVDGSLVFRPVRGAVRVNGTAYHGAVLVRPAVTGVTAVNLLDMESYLKGVVPLEIGDWRAEEELEAVKAQAVAARTYAIRHLGRRGDLGFDYHGSMLDQVYGGADAEDPVSTRAVDETRGVIVTYDGEPIEAFYHSTCGGSTAALEEVWPGEPRPYLKSVSDREPAGGWYCDASDRFWWTESWTERQLLEALNAGLARRGAEPVTEVEALEARGRTPSGRVAALMIRTATGEELVRGDSIRRFLEPEPDRLLNSTLIDLRPRGGGRVTGLVVEGRGWGHGIGMCQNGALGRARAGQSYREILSTYYPGTRLVRLY